MKTLFVNGHVWDGEAPARKRAEVLVSDQRIEAISERSDVLSRQD